MNETTTITDQKSAYSHAAAYIFLGAVAVIIGTMLRVSLLVLYPFAALFIAAYYRFRISASLLIMLLLAGVSFLCSVYGHPFLRYKLLSLFYMIPFLLLLFSKPPAEAGGHGDHLRVFMRCLSIVALVNNIIGFIQVFNHPESDDSFIGIYSQYSISLNGLVLLNTVLYYYYFVNYLYKKNTLHLLAGIFFLCSSLMGFYGAGLIVTGIAIILSFFRFRILAILKAGVIAFASVTVIYFLVWLIKPSVIDYNKANIRKIATFNTTSGPRKLTSFYNYAISYPGNIKDFLLGSGPGTFNSRSAFMVGSPSYFTGVRAIKDNEQPYYFKHYAYPLWNETNTLQSQYLDGFRNQPFSSILAFLGEYGLLFTLAWGLLYYRYYKTVARMYREHMHSGQAEIYFRLFKFLIILLPLLLLIDNYLEYPEIMLLIILGLKFSQQGLQTMVQSPFPDGNI